MKRSVDNQLITQMFCGMLFSYIFFQPLFAWRIIIGPITPWLSVFASIVDNIFKNWMGVCFTQMVIFKVSQSFYEVVCIQMILLPQIDIFTNLAYREFLPYANFITAVLQNYYKNLASAILWAIYFVTAYIK